MNEIVKKTALVSPLDWGLGHASRLVPVIYFLLKRQWNVILGGSGISMDFLRNEFPALTTVWLPSAGIKYSKGNSQILSVLRYMPGMLFSALKEHSILKRLIHERQIDAVIADNRYGLYSADVLSIIITHQLSPAMPGGLKFMERPVHLLIKKMTGRFNECWIPDLPENAGCLTGMLTRRFPLPANAIFTGILSAAAIIKPEENAKTLMQGHQPSDNLPVNAPGAFDILVILSGPEPQKTLLLEKVISCITPSYKVSVFIAGGFASPGSDLPPGIIFRRFADASEMKMLIENAKVIICRAGYSTIMDLLAAGRPAILIPTPGQPEQEYLGKFLDKEGYFMTTEQKNKNLLKVITVFRERLRNGGFRKYIGAVNNIPAGTRNIAELF